MSRLPAGSSVESWLYFWQGQGIFLFLKSSRLALGPTKFPIQLVPYIVSTRIIRPGGEADQSDAIRAKVKNAWSCTASTPYTLTALTGILLIETFSYFIKLVFKLK